MADINNMIMIIKILLLIWVISFRIIHLGMNPVKGGIPAIDKRFKVKMSLFIFWLLEFSILTLLSLITLMFIKRIIEYMIRYIMGILEDELVINIQPMCLMEEKARIILIEEMLNWDKDPTIIDIILIVIKMNEEFNIIILIGMIFWYLIKIIELFHFILLIIFGNHMWNGDIAIFMAITRMIIMINKFIWINFLCSILMLLFENKINITVDAIAWMRKYFSMFSFWISHITKDIIKKILMLILIEFKLLIKNLMI